MPTRLEPCLWFDANAEEAVAFYRDVFPDTETTQITRAPEGGPIPPGTVLTISFTLQGRSFTALNGGPHFQFNEAVSFMVGCKDQAEIDHYWERLGEGGAPMACGWLKDRYGLCWQIVPERFFEMIGSDDAAQVARVHAAMNTMVKFDLAALEAAYRGD